MFSRRQLLRYMLIMSVWIACGLVVGDTDGHAIALVALTVLLILGGLRYSLVEDAPADTADKIADMLSVAFPLTKYTAEFVKDDKFISAFLYVYRMSPEKLMTFIRMVNEMRQSTDSAALRALSDMVKEERRKQV